MKTRVVCLIIGFICGCIPSGMIIARAKGVDLRHQGSGNVGSTNVTRALGRRMGALTLVLDMMKAVVPILITRSIYSADTDMRYLILLYTGFGAVLGHDFSPWLKFRGGKGVATSGGMVMMTDPLIFVIDFVTIFGSAFVTGYVSLGSILASVFFVIFSLITVLGGFTPGWRGYPLYYSPGDAREILLLSCLIPALCIWRHRDNIRRLIKGTENKINLLKK